MRCAAGNLRSGFFEGSRCKESKVFAWNSQSHFQNQKTRGKYIKKKRKRMLPLLFYLYENSNIN